MKTTTLDERIYILAKRIGCDYPTARFIIIELKKILDDPGNKD